MLLEMLGPEKDSIHLSDDEVNVDFNLMNCLLDVKTPN